MTDHEKHVAFSRVLKNSESDQFGVSWGEEVVDPVVDDEEPQTKQKRIKYYTSFYLNGTKYSQDDTVYLQSAEGPPHIARIGKLYENIKDKEKQMVVRWFCRPSELPEGLPDVDYSDSCKEVFMMWGNGAKNVNNPACTIRLCSVACTAGEGDWNTNPPSAEKIAAAEHVLNRVFDLKSRTLKTLECIVKFYGERYVTGIGGPPPRKKGDKTGDRISGKKSAPVNNRLSDRPAPAMRASSDRSSSRVDCSLPGLTSLPALVPSSKSHKPIPAEGQLANSLRKTSSSAMKASSDKVARSVEQRVVDERMIPKAHAHQGKKRPHLDAAGNVNTADAHKRPKMDKSSASSLQQAQEKAGGRKVVSPRLGELKKKFPQDASRPRQGQVKLSSSKDPSIPLGEGRRKVLHDPMTAEISRPQQGNGRLAGDVLSSPGAGEERRKSSNDVTKSNALRPQDASWPRQGLERLSSGKLPSVPFGEGARKVRHDPMTAEISRPQQDNERHAGDVLSSPGAGEGRRKSSNDLTKSNALRHQDASWPRQGQESLSSGKLPSVPYGEGARKVRHDPMTAEFLRPQQDNERLAGDVLSSPGAGEGRRKSSNDLTNSDALRPQEGQERFSAVKLASPGAGEVRRKPSNDLKNANGSKQALHRVASGKLVPPAAEERREKPTEDLTTTDRQGAADCIREKQKGTLKVSSKSIPLKAKKRLGINSEGELLNPKRKLSTLSHTVGVALKREVPKDKSKFSPSVASDHKIGDLKSPGVPKRSLPEKSRGRQQGQGPTALLPINQKEDGRVSSTHSGEVDHRVLTSSVGNAPPNVAVQPMSTEDRFVAKGNQDVDIEESRMKASDACNSLPSRKRPRSPSKDSGHGNMGHKVLNKRQHSDLKAGATRTEVVSKRDLHVSENRSRESGDGLSAKTTSLLAKKDPRMLTKQQSGDIGSGENRRPPQGLVNKIAKTLARKPESRGASRTVDVAPSLPTSTHAEAYQGGKFEPKKKIFKIPWEESLRIGLEQRKALLLQNLDPWFSSSEIEAMLEDVLKIGCDVRMLPPKSFSCYTSGQALVLFRTQKLAEEALRILTENWLIWSKDERPVLARMADTEMAQICRIYGFYTADMFASRGPRGPNWEGQTSAVATSHCSQPNTVEYEMGIQWRVVQDRHAEAWTIATKVQQNDQKSPKIQP